MKLSTIVLVDSSNDVAKLSNVVTTLLSPFLENITNDLSLFKNFTTWPNFSTISAYFLVIFCCKEYELLNKNRIIYLISGDADFFQLGRKNLFFTNYKSKELKELDKKEALELLTTKIILGDKSDCIPSIFTKKTALKLKKELIESDEKLIEYLNLNPESKKQYELNKKMIDFNNIPPKFYNKIIKYIN